MSTCEAAIQALQEFIDGDSFAPVFAMKKYHTGYGYRGLPNEVGFLANGRGTKLYLANIFVLVAGPLAPQLEKLPSKDYENFEAMLADGWEAD
jgi:hypothetical protein